MKRLFTLAFIALSFLSASAQYGQAILNLRLSDNSPFKLYVDGNYAGQAYNSMRLTDMQPGKHMLQVVRLNRGWGRSYEEVVYGSGIVLTGNAEQWVTVIPGMRKLQFDNIVALADPGCRPSIPGVQPVMPGKSNCTPVNNAPVFVPTGPIGPCAMNPADFTQLKQTIDNAGFESTRLTIFRQALAYNYFTTAQVCDIMDLFWFESSKVEVAKIAYSKTVDPNNYYLVNNEFSFSSSVNTLNDYIAMR